MKSSTVAHSCPFFYRLAGYMEGIYFLCCFSGDGKCFSRYQPQSLSKNPWVWFTRSKQLHFNASYQLLSQKKASLHLCTRQSRHTLLLSSLHDKHKTHKTTTSFPLKKSPNPKNLQTRTFQKERGICIPHLYFSSLPCSVHL